MRDHMMGWPPAVEAIDAPKEYVYAGRTLARPALSSQEQAERRREDDMHSVCVPINLSAVSDTHMEYSELENEILRLLYTDHITVVKGHVKLLLAEFRADTLHAVAPGDRRIFLDMLLHRCYILPYLVDTGYVQHTTTRAGTPASSIDALHVWDREYTVQGYRRA